MFVIKVTIYWKKFLMMKPTVKDHMLNFEEQGEISSFKIKFKRRLLPKYLIRMKQ